MCFTPRGGRAGRRGDSRRFGSPGVYRSPRSRAFAAGLQWRCHRGHEQRGAPRWRSVSDGSDDRTRPDRNFRNTLAKRQRLV